MSERREWNSFQLEILQDHLNYHAKFYAVLEEMITTGPSSCKKLPDFCPPPKRKLSDLYGQQTKKTKDEEMSPEKLHQYLKSKEINVRQKVRKEVFDFSLEEIPNATTAVTKLKEGYRQIQRQEATSMCFNLQYGRLLDITFELYAKEKESGAQTQNWEDWLKQNIGISPSYSRKLRMIFRLLRPYVKRFSTVGLPFIEVYSMRKDLQAMFSYSDEIVRYWSDCVQPPMCLETQSSQEPQ
jgi:hypothetical protein